MRQLAGRVAVVTGAASGIGRALALALAQKRCELALVDINRDGLEKTAEQVRAVGAKVSIHLVDVASREQMEALPEDVIREHGHIHIVVNNAGVAVMGTVEEQPLEDFEWIVGINLWGVVYGCKFFLPYLRREEEGHIVNMSSLFGILGFPELGSYNATKFAVRGLSEALHGELAATSVGVSVVHPGGVSTNIARASRLPPKEQRSKLQKRFERFGIAPEVVAARIVRAIEQNRFSVRISRETYLLDWARRFLPGVTRRLIGWWVRRRGKLT